MPGRTPKFNKLSKNISKHSFSHMYSTRGSLCHDLIFPAPSSKETHLGGTKTHSINKTRLHKGPRYFL